MGELFDIYAPRIKLTNMEENNRQLNSLLEDSRKTEEEKTIYKKSKEDFDKGYLQACKDLKTKIAVFDSQVVIVDDSVSWTYSDHKFLP